VNIIPAADPSGFLQKSAVEAKLPGVIWTGEEHRGMSSGGRGNLSLWFVAEDRRATHEGKNGLGEGLCHKSFYRFLLFVRLNIKERVFFL